MIHPDFKTFDIFAGEKKQKSLKSTAKDWTKYQQMVNFSCRISTGFYGVRTTNTHNGISDYSIFPALVCLSMLWRETRNCVIKMMIVGIFGP